MSSKARECAANTSGIKQRYRRLAFINEGYQKWCRKCGKKGPACKSCQMLKDNNAIVDKATELQRYFRG